MAETILEVRGVTKVYGEEGVQTHVLRGVDFSVAAGEFVVVLGPSGSGKSTLLNILGIMDEPTAGEVLVHGTPPGSLTEAQRACLRNERLGFVFQFDSLLHEFTVLENVAMPARISLARTGGDAGAIEAKARNELDRLGLGALADRFPHQLSGGERQRAAIARALINSPSAILADEPTGNLDRANGERVFAALREQAVASQVAVVMVTHNEEAARFASRTVHLLDGRVTDPGRQP